MPQIPVAVYTRRGPLRFPSILGLHELKLGLISAVNCPAASAGHNVGTRLLQCQMNSSQEHPSRLSVTAPRGSDTLNLRLANKKCLFFSSLTMQRLCLEPRGSSRAPFPSLLPFLPPGRRRYCIHSSRRPRWAGGLTMHYGDVGLHFALSGTTTTVSITHQAKQGTSPSSSTSGGVPWPCPSSQGSGMEGSTRCCGCGMGKRGGRRRWMAPSARDTMR